MTGFARKYAISRLNGCIRRHEHEYKNVIIKASRVELPKKKKRIYVPKYGKDTVNSLNRIWRTFDFMCGQRLVPFIRKNIGELVSEPYFEISPDVHEKLNTVSNSTANRLLKTERQKGRPRGRRTTRAAGDLNRLIPIRAFFDWDERRPGFFEMDNYNTYSEDDNNFYIFFPENFVFSRSDSDNP